MNLSELVNKHYDSLSQNDIHIWQKVSQNKVLCSKMTIDELASHCNVSRTTILRFAKKISLRGYSEFKVWLELESSHADQISDEAVEIVCDGYIKAIRNMQKKDFTAICQLIYSANRIFIFASGDIQRKVAKYLKMIFFHIGELFYDFEGLSLNDAFFSIAEPNDLAIIISLSGESKHIVDVAKKMKLQGIKILSITKLHDNTLARMSEENLYITTSQVRVSNEFAEFEVTNFFYILIEILLIRYSQFKKAIQEVNTPETK